MKRALRANKRLAHATERDEAEDGWIDFLTHANKVFTKLRAACHGQGLDWMWWRKIMDERRDDPLLCYIHHARNTDAHRLEDTVEWVAHGARVVEVTGLGEMPLAAHLCAAAVTDRGIIYQPPAEHFGVPIGYSDARIIAQLACNYLDELVIEATFRLR